MKEGWQIKKLGEVATFIGGGTPTKSKSEYYTGNIPWATVRDMKSYQLYKTEFNITEDAVKNSATNILPSGTIIISTHVGLGKICILMQETAINQDLKGVLLNSEIIKSYFSYWYQSQSQQIINNGKGATVKGVTLAFIKGLNIPVPPLSEQAEIVSELDLLNEIIEKKRLQLKELDNLSQAIFYDMFGDPVANEKGWDVKRLKGITTKIGSGATPKGGDKSYKEEGISLIRSLNVFNNVFKYKDLAFIDAEQAAKLKNVIVETLDVLLNITGASVARCCVVPSSILPARVNQHVAIIRAKRENLHPIFLSSQFTSKPYQQYLLLLSKGNGATREALTKNQLENLPIILPPLSPQQEFAEKITAIEEQKKRIQASLAETETLLNSRMDFYFN